MSLVYISSTYKDLIECRKAAYDAILRIEHTPLGMENYQATEKRPLDKCLEDVRQCKAYIGIIGWRYGFVPRGEDKSITQLEYEEAGKAGIPRMIFLAPEFGWSGLKDKNTEQIKNFRDALQENHICNEFTSLDDLKFKIAAALKKELGDGIKIPPLLAYKCNREDQYDDVSTSYERFSGGSNESGESKPFMFLIQGEECQAVNKFIECLQDQFVDILSLPDTASITWKNISWPMSNDKTQFIRKMETKLRKALIGSVGGGNAKGIEALLSGVDGLLVLRFSLFNDDWGKSSGDILQVFTDYWLSMDLSERLHPIIIFLTVDYRVYGGYLKRFVGNKKNRMVRSDLQKMDESIKAKNNFVSIAELEDVSFYHATLWTETNEVKELVDGERLKERLSSIYNNDEGMAMRPLASELITCLRDMTN